MMVILKDIAMLVLLTLLPLAMTAESSCEADSGVYASERGHDSSTVLQKTLHIDGTSDELVNSDGVSQHPVISWSDLSKRKMDAQTYKYKGTHVQDTHHMWKGDAFSKILQHAFKRIEFSELFPSARMEDLDASFAASAKAATSKDASWLHREAHLTSKDREERNHRLRMFNPSVVQNAHNSTQFAFRLSSASRCCGRFVCNSEAAGIYRAVVKCENNSNSVECSRPFPDLDDPHGFTMNGRNYFSANSYKAQWDSTAKRNKETCTVKIVDLNTSTVSQVHLPGAARCEKNWAPFVENGTLFMTYALSPEHRVIRCDTRQAKAGWSCKFAYHSKALLTRQGLPRSQTWSGAHGGSPYVELDEKYMLAIAHNYNTDTVRQKGHWAREYWHTFYAIERQPPYRIVANTPWFQFPNLESDENADWKGIQYAGGLAYTNDGDLLVSFGVGDCHSRSLSLRVGDVRQALGM